MTATLPLGQYMVYEPFFVMAQYEYRMFATENFDTSFDGIFVGGGYTQNLGSKAAINFFVLYNLTFDPNDENDGYLSPFAVGGNITFGL